MVLLLMLYGLYTWGIYPFKKKVQIEGAITAK